MPPAEQKTFLFALCGISCTAEEINSATGQYLRRAGVPEDQAREAATRVQALLPRGFSGDPAILEGMEKRAREQRREVKKDLERTRAALAELELPNLPEGMGLEDKEAVEKQLVELEIEKSELLKAHGAHQAAEQNITKYRGKINELAAEIERLNSNKAGLEREVAGHNRAGLAGELDRLQERLEQLTGKIAASDRKLAALEAAGRAKHAVVEKLRAFDGRCPLAPEQIACRMSGSEVAELVNQLGSEINAGSEKMNQLRASLQKLQAEKQDMQQRITDLKHTLSGLDTARQELRGLESAIDGAQKELNSAWQEVAAWEEALQKGGANPEEIDRLQERIVQGREILRRLEVAGYGRRQARQLQQDLELLEKELAVTERMVKALGPDGIRKTLLGDRLAGFTREINNLLTACTEGRYQLTWQGDFTPLITRNGRALPLKLLSKKRTAPGGYSPSNRHS
ncbi:hypothetical protein [Desulfolucanica intricata]|uniref:hypothetical protein n=1 Tax=Desulfolucanica intricata TaxID=1285191 RepID=UPI003F7658FA